MFTGQLAHISLFRAGLLGSALCAALMLGSCDKDAKPPAAGTDQPKTTTGSGKGQTPEFLPVPRMTRKTPDVDQRVRKAWWLTEVSYLVVGDHYKSATEMMKSKDLATVRKGAALKATATEDIQKKLFATNPEVVKLFEKSISDNPENPLNIASYAFYLQPRKSYTPDGNFTEQYEKSLQLMDQAIKLWPDEANFYLDKVALMTAPLKVHEWTRSLSLEEKQIQAQLPEVRKLLEQAEKYDPENHMINYWRAQLVARLTPSDHFDQVRDEVLEQIRTGNTKVVGHFAFPPPCDPFPEEAHFVKIMPEAQDAQLYDGWMNFGYYDQAGQLAIYGGLLPSLHWPKDKQAVADVMFMLYNMGRTKPFDTTYFSWQQKILVVLMDDPAISQADKAQLAAANFMLTDYYTTTAQQLAAVPLMYDPTKFDVIGLSLFETTTSRQPRQREVVQPLHASYLHEVAPVLGLPPFPLPDDPKHWGD
jgi:hypothetical protein